MYVWVGALVKKGANALLSCAPRTMMQTELI